MRKTFAYGAAASQGSWPVQEDGFFVDPTGGSFVLADGFGGRGKGDIAAKLALSEWRAAKPELNPREGGIFSPAQAWQRDAFAEINKKLLQWNEKRAASARGGCSLVAATLSPARELTVTGCGACAAFLVRYGQWIPLLAPQASARRAADDSLFPSQALGLGRELNPESRSLGLEPGDLVFLFSSGLAWEREGFFAELSSQLALRLPGTDLGEIAALAAGTAAPPGPWNQAVVVVEALSGDGSR